ncbi:MAG TPA: glycosyltransferase family 4 protein [Alphaproteobacteria bacterium]
MILGIFLYCAVVAGLAAAVTYGVARRRLLLDHPNERSSHATPVPRSGGLGIVTATVLGMLALGIDGHPAVLRDNAFFAVLLGGLIAAMGGFADDVSTRSFLFKLGVQSAAGGIAIALGLVVDTLYIAGIGPVHLGAFGPVVTLLWLVGMTNAYNFMDGIDGLAGGTAVIAGIFLTLAAINLAQINESTIACTLAAASLGFLVFNLPPAKIFMGDVGSQFLGFGFAATGVLMARYDTTGTLILLVPLLLFHFIFDTAYTAIRRARLGENVTQAHRSHLYQRFAHSGFGHGRATALLSAIAVLQGAGALWMVQLPPASRPLVFLPALALQLVYLCVVVRRENAKARASA